MDPQKKELFRKELLRLNAIDYGKIVGTYPEYINKISTNFGSSVDRQGTNAQIIKYLFPILEKCYNTTVFKATRKRFDKKYIADNVKMRSAQAGLPYDSSTAIYAYLYSDKDDNHKYFCYGPTFRSQDGEYRGRFLQFTQLLKIEEHYQKQLEIIEEFVVEKMNSGEFEFHVDFCFMKNYHEESKFQNKLDESRLVIRLFCLAWFCDFYRIYMKIMENHMNPSYQLVIFDKKDIPIYNSVEKITPNMHFTTDIMLQSYVPNYSTYNMKYEKLRVELVRTGQKLIPITIRETMNPTDINFPAWREMYITQKCSTLVPNFIAPNFPIVNNWFYIQNGHAGIFDNLAQYKKYENSKTATDIGEYLRDADRLTIQRGSSGGYEINTSHAADIDKFESDNVIAQSIEDTQSIEDAQSIEDTQGGGSLKNASKKYINERFEGLSRKINGSILYNESTLRLSDAILCINMEYVGRTFRDLPSLVVSGEDRAPITATELFSSIEMFTRYMFDITYATYAMSTKLWIFHGDSHLNNITMFNFADYRLENGDLREGMSNPHIVYGVENGQARDDDTKNLTFETEYYMFNHFGSFAMFIDFSRGIIADESMLVADFGEIFAAQYMKKQNNRVMRTIAQNFPSFFERNKKELEIALLKNFKLVFKAISCLDIFTISKHMTEMLKLEKNLKVHPSIIKLSDRLRYFSEDILIKGLKKVIHEEIKELEKLDWPCYLIIREIFGKHEINGDDKPLTYKNGAEFPADLTVCERFTMGNDVKYTLERYDEYPPLLKFDNEIIAAKNIGEKPLPWIAKTKEDMKKTEDAMDDLYKIVDQYKEEYSPSAFIEDSSWKIE